jgi:NRAMP (natural resistance-associated macrophage protein)-like metal ion transporter
MAARRGVWRSIGLGLITGAADDDPSAIGTYASAGAALGPSFLWTAPVTLPMMFVVVFLSAKLGQVAGRGLFAVMAERYPPWLLNTALVGVIIGNIIEAAADVGGMAAALTLFVPVSRGVVVLAVTAAILAMQFWGSYVLIRNVFRVLALGLLAYVAAAILARPSLGDVVRGTFIPRLRFDREFLGLLVAVVGTTLSAYLYSWQSNEEVEEEIAMGRRRLAERKGTTRAELRETAWDVAWGMIFSNVVMYFIILAAAATLFSHGVKDITSAADAAEALRPLAGDAAAFFFAAGIIGAGFLAVPVMTTGAAYDLCQTLKWKHGLYAKPSKAPRFYAAIAVFTLIALGLNFVGINPMKALVVAGVVQGFSTPPLMLLIMLTTNDRKVMGRWVNSRASNVLGWTTTVLIFAASAALVASWVM